MLCFYFRISIISANIRQTLKEIIHLKLVQLASNLLNIYYEEEEYSLS